MVRRGQGRPLQGDDMRGRPGERGGEGPFRSWKIAGVGSGDLCSHQWTPTAHHSYDFQVFFTVNVCFQDGMSITSQPPTSYFLSAVCTGAILSRDYGDGFFE